MGYIIAVDCSLTMGLTTAGDVPCRHVPPAFREPTRFEVGSKIAEIIMQRASRLNVEPSVHLFRISDMYENLGEVVTAEDVYQLSYIRHGGPVQMYGCANFSHFLRYAQQVLHPGMEDKIIIITDCATFQGDMNYNIHCETRFIIVNSNKATMCPDQLKEIDEIAASSIGLDPTKENESLYHAFFIGDFVHRGGLPGLVRAVFEEMFQLCAYTLELGHMRTLVKIGHDFEEPISSITIIGFLRGTAFLNIETDTSHLVYPVFYNEFGDAVRPRRRREARRVRGADSDSSEDVSTSEYDTVVEEVTDDEPEPEPPAPAPRVSFIPYKALTTEEAAAAAAKAAGVPFTVGPARIDFSAVLSGQGSSGGLPDFVPPPGVAMAAPPPAPAEPVKTTPKRVYKVVSRTGVQSEYIAGGGKIVVAPPAPEGGAAAVPAPKKVTPPKRRRTKMVTTHVRRVRTAEEKRIARSKRATIRRLMARHTLKQNRLKRRARKAAKPKRVVDEEALALAIEANSDDTADECWSTDSEYDASDEEEERRKRKEAKKEEAHREKRKSLKRKAKKESKRMTREAVKKAKQEKEEKKKEKKKEKKDGVKAHLPFGPTTARRVDQSPAAQFSAPFLMQALTAGMLGEDLYAVALLSNGRYAILAVEEHEEGNLLLQLSNIVHQHLIPPMVPLLEQLVSLYDPTPNIDNMYLSQLVGQENPSYVSARSSWFHEEGIEADFIRIVKNLRKMPERLPYFYSDINRMRMHAYTTCNQSFLVPLADQLVEESRQFGEVALRHAEYIAAIYRTIVPFTEVREIPMANF